METEHAVFGQTRQLFLSVDAVQSDGIQAENAAHILANPVTDGSCTRGSGASSTELHRDCRMVVETLRAPSWPMRPKNSSPLYPAENIERQALVMGLGVGPFAYEA